MGTIMRAGAPLMTAARASPECGPMHPHPTCSIPGCDDRHLARGWCKKHYRRWQAHGDPLGGGSPRPRGATVAERFWAKVVGRGLGGCWLWTGALNSSGYGHFKVGGRTVVAHRWAYEQEVGPIPDGLTIDHLCRVRACVKVEHLEVVTNQLNTLRGIGLAARNARKTHCLRGHEFTAKNTYIRPVGKRVCRACDRQRHRPRELRWS